MLPTQVVKATRQNPKRLIIYGKPKVGKTTILSKLDGCCILDLEDGSDHVDALKVKILGLRPEKAETPEQVTKRQSEMKYYINEFANEIAKYRKENAGKYPYKIVAVDTITQLEMWCEDYGTKMFMDSVQGKKFNRDKTGAMLPKGEWESVLSLPNGAGYLWLRLAFEYWLKIIDTMAPDIILVGHLKDKIIEKDGKELNAKDLDLTGKIGKITAASSDAIGYIYRNKDKTIINFNSQDDTCGARPKHLQGKEITIMDGTTAHWEEIYID